MNSRFSEGGTFTIGVDMRRVIETLSEQIYDTPIAFLRENVQNAIDAVRIQSRRGAGGPGRAGFEVAILVHGNNVQITDNGIGMTLQEQREFFWTMGASGKRTQEARDAGCIGSFGIGGFANAGVCTSLTVTSRSEKDTAAHWTRFFFADLANADGKLPEVQNGVARNFMRRGTVLDAELRGTPKVAELKRFIQDCVRYAEERVTFNGELISQQRLRIGDEAAGDVRALTEGDEIIEKPGESPPDGYYLPSETAYFSLDLFDPVPATSPLRSIRCRWFEDDDHSLYAGLSGMTTDTGPARLDGIIRVRKGPVDVRRRGFKICASENRIGLWAIADQLELSGVIDSDLLSPTAGRDSLDAKSEQLLTSVMQLLRESAARRILESAARIDQHPEVYDYLALRNDDLQLLSNATVSLTGGEEMKLSDIRARAAEETQVYFSAKRGGVVASFLKSHGGVVVELPAERRQARVIQRYLETFCHALSADSRIELLEEYPKSSYGRFDIMFIEELEEVLVESYHMQELVVRTGKLSSNLAAYATSEAEGRLELYVDLRHDHVRKLHGMPNTLISPAVRQFCLEFLGDALRKASPRLFTDGTSAFANFFRDRAEEWVLVRGEIIEFAASDIHEVVPDEPWQPEPGHAPKLIHVRPGWHRDFGGYYLRMPGGLVKGYMNELLDFRFRAATWVANLVQLYVSDGVDAAFGVQLKLDSLVLDGEGGRGRPGSAVITSVLLKVYGELYFPIPREIEPSIVPAGSRRIRVSVSYDFLGM